MLNHPYLLKAMHDFYKESLIPDIKKRPPKEQVIKDIYCRPKSGNLKTPQPIRKVAE
jgi:hypothetical protein